jgi:hypothetical protein
MNKATTYLTVYAGLLTVGLAVTTVQAFRRHESANEPVSVLAAVAKPTDVLDVQRINVREADGTLRMVISNQQRFPGAFIKGKEYPHQRNVAGMVFYNNEGTENGGLIFNGAKSADGSVSSGVHLSFDPYERDQAMVVQSIESEGKRAALLRINDVGNVSVEEGMKVSALPEAAQEKFWAEKEKAGDTGANRVILGRNTNGNAQLLLADAKGTPRLQLTVNASGEAVMEFLDKEGNVTASLTPTMLAALKSK